MIDTTIHVGDVITLASLGIVGWQRVSSCLRAVEAFMDETRRELSDLNRRVDLLEIETGAIHRRKGIP